MVIYIVTGAFILMDMITGLIKAFKKKEYTSSVMREGLFHKAGSVLVIVLGVLVDYAQGFLDLGVTIPLAAAICTYIIMMEIGSIIENVCEINPRIVPAKLQSYFQKLATSKEKEEVKETEQKEEDIIDNAHSDKG